MALNFEILINDSFSNHVTNETLSPTTNKHILSIANGFEDSSWMYDKFQKFIWNNIAETALSERERQILSGEGFSAIVQSAKNLRLTDKENDSMKGSELAEIVLYGLMKHHYNALPVVPKIFYKQNPQDNAKGADSVHVVLEGESDFSIWFGEAKFYNSIEDARLATIIESVEKSLKKEKLKKENSIVTSLHELDLLVSDKSLCQKIKDAISPQESIDNLKPKLHIPILLLHECAITQKQLVMSDEYRDEIKAYHLARAESYFEKQIDKLGGVVSQYSDINFHIILLPVPEKKAVVDNFIATVEHFKGQ